MKGMTPERAETIALQALGWIAGQEDMLAVFLGATGASRRDLVERVGEPEFLLAVLDFLLLDDAWIAAFCRSEGLAPSDPAAARAALPGGAEMNWT